MDLFDILKGSLIVQAYSGFALLFAIVLTFRFNIGLLLSSLLALAVSTFLFSFTSTIYLFANIMACFIVVFGLFICLDLFRESIRDYKLGKYTFPLVIGYNLILIVLAIVVLLPIPLGVSGAIEGQKYKEDIEKVLPVCLATNLEDVKKTGKMDEFVSKCETLIKKAKEESK